MSPSLSDQVTLLSSQLDLLQEYIEFKFGVDFKEFQSFKETHPCGGFVVVKKSNLFNQSHINGDIYDETINNDDEEEQDPLYGDEEEFEQNDNIGIVVKSETVSPSWMSDNFDQGDDFDQERDVPVYEQEGQYVTGDDDMHHKEEDDSVNPNIGVLSRSSRSDRMPDLTPIPGSTKKTRGVRSLISMRGILPLLKKLGSGKSVAKTVHISKTLKQNVTSGIMSRDSFSAVKFIKHDGAHRHAEFGVEYKMTERGERMLYRDYLFRVNKHDWKNGRIYWLCVGKKCPARISQDENGRPIQNRMHNHPKFIVTN